MRIYCWSVGVATLLLGVALLPDLASACTCMPAHPQEIFCKADFVILATVKREFHQRLYRLFKVKIRKEFKATEKARIALRQGRLVTAMHSAACGVQLQPRRTYVLSGRVDGGRAHLSLCGVARTWRDVGHRQRKGYRLLYGRGCDCQPRACWSGGNCRAAMERACAWNVHSTCQTQHGICLRGGDGLCHWTRSLALKRCLYGADAGSPRPQPPPLEPYRQPSVSNHTATSRSDRGGYYHYSNVPH